MAENKLIKKRNYRLGKTKGHMFYKYDQPDFVKNIKQIGFDAWLETPEGIEWQKQEQQHDNAIMMADHHAAIMKWGFLYFLHNDWNWKSINLPLEDMSSILLSISGQSYNCPQISKQLIVNIMRKGSLDFPDNISPYDLIVQYSSGNLSMFMQYAALVRKYAQQKNCDMEKVEQFLEKARYQCSGPYATVPEFIVAYLKAFSSTREEGEDNSRITACPIMCGAGKSMAVSRFIVDRAEQDIGLLVVTDSISRMNDYIRNAHDQNIQQRLDDLVDEGKIALMNRDNRSTVMNEQYKCPVLIITTQHYFQIGRDGILHYLNWKGGRRQTILIDEAAYIKQTQDIDLSSFNEVMSLLQTGAGGDQVNAEEKQWCIEQWRSLTKKIEETINTYENDNRDDRPNYRFYVNPTGTMTEDDSRFLSYINSSSSYMNHNNPQNVNSRQMIDWIYQLMTQYGIYHYSGDKNYYNSSFCVTINNRDKLMDLGAKVIVLDGTADVHPDYWDQSLVEMYDFSTLNRRLDGLTIKFADFASGSTTLQDSKQLESAFKYIDARYPDKEKVVIFSYKNLMQKINIQGYHKTGYLGNLRGFNSYREEKDFIQLGLYRCPQLVYVSYELSRHPDKVDELKSLTEQQASQQVSKMVTNVNGCREIMFPMILADLEQNMFRGAIRNADFLDNMNYTVICSLDEYADLISKAKLRYEQLGAKVLIDPLPPELLVKKIMERAGGDQAKSICDFVTSLQINTVFTKNDIVRETGLTKKQINTVLSRGATKDLFAQMEIEGQRSTWEKRW